MAYCSNCGHELKVGELFCTQCGTKYENANVEQGSKMPELNHLNSKKTINRILPIAILLIVAIIGIVLIKNVLAPAPEKAIVGTWYLEETYELDENPIVFDEDGTCYFGDEGIPGKYQISDGKLSIRFSELYENTSITYEYKIKNNKLILTIDGEDIVYEKQ